MERTLSYRIMKLVEKNEKWASTLLVVLDLAGFVLGIGLVVVLIEGDY